MTDQYRVTTPEAVTISYDVAGIGSRFLAQVIDFGVIICSFILIGFATVGIGSVTSGSSSAELIFALTASFLLVWGYYLAFEAFWNGQTPGKRIIGIRVIKTSGLPLGFIDSVVRNLVRFVDWLPWFYGIGLLVMFVSPRPRRLGDYAAGTLVIHERLPLTLGELSVDTGAFADGSCPIPGESTWQLTSLTLDDAATVRRTMQQIANLQSPAVRERKLSELAGRVAGRIDALSPDNPGNFLNRVLALYAGHVTSEEMRYQQAASGPELAWNLRALTREDTQIIEEFLARAPGLRPESRSRLGSQIAAQIATKIGAEDQDHPETFLLRVSVLSQVEADWNSESRR